MKKVIAYTIVLFVATLIMLNLHSSLRSAAATPTTPAIGVCGVRQNSDIQQYTGPTLPYNNVNGFRTATTHVMPAAGNALRYWPGTAGQNPRWYTMSRSNHPVTGAANYSTDFKIYDATTNALIKSFRVAPSSNTTDNNMAVGSFDVDPETGDVYVGAYNDAIGGAISRWKTDGTMVWKKPVGSLLVGGIYGYTDPSGMFRIAGSIGEPADPWRPTKSATFAANGNSLGFNAVAGKDISVSSAHNNDIVAINDGYVRIYTAAGDSLRQSIGSDLTASQAGPWHFYIINGATVLADGSVVVYDAGRGLELFTSDSVYKGKITADILNPDNHAGGVESMNDRTGLVLLGNKLHYLTGDNSGAITAISVDTMRDYIAYPQGAPFHLGIGAGPFTSAKNNHFPPGTTPQVSLRFYDSWRTNASTLTGSYTIRSIEQIKRGEPGTATSYTIPADPAQYANGYADVPATIPSTSPGLYEMNVVLQQNGQTVGADCLRYSIGAPGTLLDFNSPNLATGGDVAEIEFAHQIGQKLYRSDYTIRNCYPGVTTASESTPINCPAAMVADITAAANLARQYGIDYEIIMSDGSTPCSRPELPHIKYCLKKWWLPCRPSPTGSVGTSPIPTPLAAVPTT